MYGIYYFQFIETQSIEEQRVVDKLCGIFLTNQDPVVFVSHAATGKYYDFSFHFQINAKRIDVAKRMLVRGEN